ncbi:MAG: metallophosphoesterase [Pseudomonadota bacterium]
MTRIIQYTDTHLRNRQWRHQGGFSRAVRKAGRADLAIITGDLTVDGADHLADLKAAHARFEALKYPWRAIPGNHDIGEEPASPRQEQSVNAERLARYGSVFGRGDFVEDVPGWRLIGLNIHLFGTGLPDESTQWQMIERAIAERGERRVGLFIHKPLFIEAPSEPEIAYWAVASAARDRLLALAKGGEAIAFVSSGHLHQGLIREVDGVRHVWCPATANSAREMRTSGAMPGTGFAVWQLRSDGSYRVNLDFV